MNPIEVQTFLKGIDYPSDRLTVLETAHENGADENVLETLDRLPPDRFNSPNVSAAIGKSHGGAPHSYGSG